MVSTAAVFDLDGTLTRLDTLVPFLSSVSPRRMARHGPPLIVSAKLHPARRDDCKEQLIDSLLAGHTLDKVEDEARRFFGRYLRAMLRPSLMKCLRDHQDSGHQVVLASASPSFTVDAIAERLGVEQVLCTRMTVTDDQRWRYRGPNLRGEAKLRAVEKLAAELGPSRVVAYGDSADDLPMLRWADEGYRVVRTKFGRIELRPVAPA